ncbi:MAG TPA: phosphate regulon transcriptional regulatory protein PhoB [Gammaproteobacteria bacterium]|nr:phosphate regulon transcriptional regulatory protein PhoB [Gammaproteobacteria bacterium]
MTSRILFIEDEPAIREMVELALTRAGYEVASAQDARSAQACLSEQYPDLILLDWMLPDTSGLDLARRLRRDKQTRSIPIIMLTARDAESDMILGLESGADDYMTKPFSPRELVARIKALLRRSVPHSADETIEHHGLRLDTASQRLSADGEEIKLGPTEYRLIRFFMAHPERVYSRAQLLDHVWGQTTYVEERTVDVHIRRLRKALEPSGRASFIETVRGSGYRFHPHS